MDVVNGEINKTGYINYTNMGCMAGDLIHNQMVNPRVRAYGSVTFVDGPHFKTADIRVFHADAVGLDNHRAILAHTSNEDLARVLGVRVGQRFVLAHKVPHGAYLDLDPHIKSVALVGRVQDAPAASPWTWETVLSPWQGSCAA